MSDSSTGRDLYNRGLPPENRDPFPWSVKDVVSIRARRVHERGSETHGYSYKIRLRPELGVPEVWANIEFVGEWLPLLEAFTDKYQKQANKTRLSRTSAGATPASSSSTSGPQLATTTHDTPSPDAVGPEIRTLPSTPAVAPRSSVPPLSANKRSNPTDSSSLLPNDNKRHRQISMNNTVSDSRQLRDTPPPLVPSSSSSHQLPPHRTPQSQSYIPSINTTAATTTTTTPMIDLSNEDDAPLPPPPSAGPTVMVPPIPTTTTTPSSLSTAPSSSSSSNIKDHKRFPLIQLLCPSMDPKLFISMCASPQFWSDLQQRITIAFEESLTTLQLPESILPDIHSLVSTICIGHNAKDVELYYEQSLRKQFKHLIPPEHSHILSNTNSTTTANTTTTTTTSKTNEIVPTTTPPSLSTQQPQQPQQTRSRIQGKSILLPTSSPSIVPESSSSSSVPKLPSDTAVPSSSSSSSGPTGPTATTTSNDDSNNKTTTTTTTSSSNPRVVPGRDYLPHQTAVRPNYAPALSVIQKLSLNQRTVQPPSSSSAQQPQQLSSSLSSGTTVLTSTNPVQDTDALLNLTDLQTQPQTAPLLQIPRRMLNRTFTPLHTRRTATANKKVQSTSKSNNLGSSSDSSSNSSVSASLSSPIDNNSITKQLNLQRKKRASKPNTANTSSSTSRSHSSKKASEVTYTVEYIRGHQYNGTIDKFHVKWEGYDLRLSTWEPLTNFIELSPIWAYLKTHPDAELEARVKRFAERTGR